MMRKRPHHGLENWLVFHNFYIGLLYNTRMTLDAATRGALMNKPYDEAYALIKDMNLNHYQWGSEWALTEKTSQKCGLYEVSVLDHMNTKVNVLYKHHTCCHCRRCNSKLQNLWNSWSYWCSMSIDGYNRTHPWPDKLYPPRKPIL